MTEERKPMSLDELTAAVLDLPPGQRAELIERVGESLYPVHDVDPEMLSEARRQLADMKSGRTKGIPMEQLLDELDRMAQLIESVTGGREFDPAWEGEMNRRMDEIEAGTANTLSEDEFFAKLKTRHAARPGS